MLKRAYIEITNVCNLRCSFCPGTGRKRELMTPERFRLLAEKLRGHVKYLYLHVMGGAPAAPPAGGDTGYRGGPGLPDVPDHQRDAAGGAGRCRPGGPGGP